jgi:autotransporter-associated beta strand protein
MCLGSAGSILAQTLTINNDIQTYATLGSTTVTMTGRSELHITGATAPITGSTIHLNSSDAWFFMDGIRPNTVNSTYLSQVRINGASAVHGTNCRVVQYGDGTVVIPHAPSFSPMTVYGGKLFTGSSLALTPYTAYGTTQLGALNDNISSFKLKRGYMATLAQGSNGTGVSRCYVAQDGDLDVAVLQSNLDDQVSFIRVFPWRWVNKKGIAGNIASGLNVRWWYNWNLDQNSSLNEEYVAIRQTRWWPGLGQNWQTRGINHLLGYNEPDHVDQANLSVADAISSWPDLLGTGLRVGSPAVTDGGRSTWLYPFMEQAETNDYRVDFVAVHYYRCSSPTDAAGAATQMYNFLKEIHDTTGKPIWITEWNQGANWTGCGDPTGAQHSAAVSAMMDMLEETPWVERYALYNWVEDVRRVKWDDGSLTTSGVTYRDKPSRLSYWQDIPSSTLPAGAFWRFENSAIDNSGNGNIAILKNGAKYGTGKTGQGVALAGNGGYVQLAKRIGDSTDFTFGAWVNWDGGAAWQRIFDLGKDTDNSIFLTPSASSGAVRFGIEIGGVQQQLNHTAALPVNTWTHVAVTISGNTGKLFINGTLVATNSSMTHNPSAVGTEFNYLGKSQWTDPTFDGELDDVTFLPYALADAKIATMMTNNPPAFASDVITGTTGTQGAPYTGSISASDPDAGDTRTYAKLAGPSWLTVSSNGTLSGTPPSEEEGLEEFIVSVTDSAGLTDTAVLNITLPTILGNGTWTANASGSWGTASNWTSNFPANGEGNTADFSTINITANTTVTLDRARSIGSLNFGDTSGTQTWTLASTGPALTLDATTPTVRVNQNTATISLTLAGTAGMRKAGLGTLVLGGDNSLTGTLNIDTDSGTADDGVVRITNPDALSSFSAIAIRNNNSGRSRLELDGTTRDIVAGGNIALSARSTANTTTAIRSIAGNNILSGALTLGVGGGNYILQSDAGTLTLEGAISSTAGSTRTLTFTGSGGFLLAGEMDDDSATSTVLALTKNGTGSLTLADKDNTFSGNIVINGGILSASSSVSFNFGNAPMKGPLGNPSDPGRTITIASGGTLAFATGNVFGGGGNTTAPTIAITVNTGGLLKTAAPPATTPGPGGGDANIFGPIILAGGTFTTGNGYSPTYQSAILLGTLTTTGSALSTINTNATNLTSNGVMLGKTGGGTVTMDIGSGGLLISAPLTNSPGTGAGARF